MTRTQKYEALFTRKIRREMISPRYTVVPYGHNRTKQAYYEMCHQMCTEWETNEMSERLDGQAMDREWTRMQDKTEQETN